MDVFKEYFYLDEHKMDKCKKIHFDYGKALEAEKIQMSDEFSPGVVLGQESLARILISPFMCNLRGDELTPDAMDDIFNKGLSVNRIKFMTSAAENFKIGQAMVDEFLDRPGNEEKKRSSPSYAIGSAGALRALRMKHDVDPDKQLMGVYDSALSEAPYHADVCVVVKPNKELKGHLKCEVLKCFNTKIIKDES